MQKEKAYSIILEIAKKSYEISIESIRAYDKRVHQITILTTTSLGILFAVIGFSNLDFFSDFSNKLSNYPLIVIPYIITLVVTIGAFIASLIFSLKAYRASKIGVLNPHEVKDGYDSLPADSDFMGELIYQIGDVFEDNASILKMIWINYKRSIICVAIGWMSLAIFIFFAFYTSFTT